MDELVSLDTNKLNGPYATVFDVGAFRGDFAKACLKAWPNADVHSFEPLSRRPNDLPHEIRWHPVALGPTVGSVRMWRCEFVPSSSMLPMNDLHKDSYPYTRKNIEVTVAQVTLSEYHEMIMQPALLKIDVQGYELEVLKGCCEKYDLCATLDLFAAVALEVSHEELYDGAPSYDDLDGFLTRAGLKHAWRLDEMLQPHTNLLLQSDELYLR